MQYTRGSLPRVQHQQASPADKITFGKMETNLIEHKQPNGTVKFETWYTFLKDPLEVFEPSQSNFSTAKHQAEKTFGQILKDKGGKRAS